MKIKTLSVLLLLLFSLAACSDSDDVVAIFTGKTWKLNVIYSLGKEDLSYWSDKETHEASMKKKKERGFNVKFDGAQVDNIVTGTFTGQGYDSSFSGNWSCNADRKNIHITSFETRGSENDVFAKAFVNAMKNVTGYRPGSDINNLYLDFKEGVETKYMSFTVIRGE